MVAFLGVFFAYLDRDLFVVRFNEFRAGDSDLRSGEVEEVVFVCLIGYYPCVLGVVACARGCDGQ